MMMVYDVIDELRQYEQFWIGNAHKDDALRDTCRRAADRIEYLEKRLRGRESGAPRDGDEAHNVELTGAEGVRVE